jgi:hypothetical protein
MRKILKSITVFLVFVMTATALPANAASTTLWSTTSKSQWVSSPGSPQIETNESGDTSVVTWRVRTSQETSKLYAKVKSSGTWSESEVVSSFPYDWWVEYDVQVTNSGSIFIGVGNSDYALTVYKRTAVNTWTPTIVDRDDRWTLGAFTVGGSVAGEVVTFTSNIQITERNAVIKSWTLDNGLQNPTWDGKEIRNVTRTSGEFSICSYNSRYWASCAIRLNTPDILEMDDGSQVLLVTGYRDSSKSTPPGTEYKAFMAHRSGPFTDWVWDGSYLTMTMGSKDEGHAFFPTPAVVTSDDHWAIAITTGRTTTKFNTVKLFTGSGTSALPVESDATYLVGRKGTENPVLIADGTSIKMAFENNFKTYFGTVGSLSSSVRMSNVTTSQNVKGLVKVNGSIVALIQTGRSATYVSKLTGSTWGAQIKLLSYGDAYTPVPSPVGAIGTEVIAIAPRWKDKRTTGVYMNEYTIG